MNSTVYITSIPVVIDDLHPVLSQFGYEFVSTSAYLLFVPVLLLYLAIYNQLKGNHKTYACLTLASLVTFLSAPLVTPIRCGTARCLENFAIAIGTMKLLDLYARRNNLPKYTAGPPPPDRILALIILTELRYESFTPNHIRVPRHLENFSEPLQLAVHIGIFAVLQALPQRYPTVLAFEVQLAIYIIWTSLQLVLRYKTSPALFGPLYRADSLTGFWSETWHNAFASPCTSLAYSPLRHGLPKYGVPVPIARSLGVLGAFVLMAIFHGFCLIPIMTPQGLYRIAAFFVINGIATVCEAMVWGRKRHWLKTVLAWIFETSIATWTAAGVNIPKGLDMIDWGNLC